MSELALCKNYSKFFCESKIDTAIDDLKILKLRLNNHYSEMDMVNVEEKKGIENVIDGMQSSLDEWIKNLENSKQSLKV